MRDYRTEVREAFARLPGEWSFEEHTAEGGTPYVTVTPPWSTHPAIVTPDRPEGGSYAVIDGRTGRTLAAGLNPVEVLHYLLRCGGE